MQPASSAFRIFQINSGKNVAIVGLTIANGSVTGIGAGILNDGTLTVNNSTFSGNSANIGGSGGAIANSAGGTLTVNNSTFSANTADGGSGGAIASSGTLNVTNSTFSGNSAINGGAGGAVSNGAGDTATVTNCTFSGNSASFSGGGIFNLGTLNLRNTIIANSTNGDCVLFSAGAIGQANNNLIKDAANACGLTNTNGNLIGSDPNLGPLANNGGPTMTFALLAGSLAIDAGDDCVFSNTCSPSLGVPLTTDQRGAGFSRKLDGDGNGTATADIGAYEAPAAPSITPTPVTRHQNSALNSQIATVTDPIDANTVVVTVNGGTTATVNGVTVSNITNSLGTVSADVTADCTATDASFTLTATNSGGGASVATLNVTVTANTLPVLTYNAASVPAGGATTINPATGPSDDVGVTSIVVQDPGTYTGTISVNSSSGVVSISNAAPTGSHTITIRASDNCGFTDTQFTLQVVAPDTSISLSSGNLTVTDNNGNNNDTFTISLNVANVRITDPNHDLGCGAGSTTIDAHTCEVPFSSITGNLHVDALGGDDSLTIALAGGNCIPPGGISYDGGTQTSTGDKLAIIGGSQGTVTYNYSNAHDGSVVMSSYGTVSYTGLEPLSNSGTSSDIIFNLPAGPTAATLGDDGTASNGISRLSGATFEQTDFANPTGSLTINRGNASDTITVNALPDFNASLTIGSGVNPFTTVTFNGAVTLASNRNLSANASATINVSDDLTTSGTGTISLSGTNVTGGGFLTTGGGLTVSNTGSSSTVSGVIAGNGGFTKQGAGTLALSGTNTYSGATTVSGGSLFINGSIASNTTVNGGGTLGGIGAINSGNTLTVNSGGAVAPGTSPGILNVGSVTFISGSSFNVEINGTTAGTGYDQLTSTGTISLGGATLNLSGTHVPTAGDTFVILNNNSADTITGNFTMGAGGTDANGGALAEGDTITNFLGSALSAKISYAGGSNSNDAVLTVFAPVPGTLQFSAANFNDTETNANHNATITVTRTGGSDGIVSVHWATSAGTATAGTDYTEASGDLSWGDGETADKTFTVAVIGDKLVETNETVNLTLSAPTGGVTIGGTNPATLTIVDDDHAPLAVNSSETTFVDLTTPVRMTATDADNNPQSFSIVDLPQHGTLSPATPTSSCFFSTCTGTINYTPNTGYTGPDSFTFKSNDGANDSNVATVSINVIVNPNIASINISFRGGGSLPGADITGVAGLVPSANWNNEANATGTDSSIVDNAGTPTGSILTWNSPNTWASDIGQNQNGLLMQGYLDNNPGNPSSVTITNLPASIAGDGTKPYDVIVYITGDVGNDGRGGIIDVNGVQRTALTKGPSADGVFTRATAQRTGNYVMFSNITGTTLTITCTANLGGNPRVPLDGFQILGLTESFVVTTTVDEDDGPSDPSLGTGTSLREAIAANNSDSLTHTITFNIPNTDPGCSGGVCTINVGATGNLGLQPVINSVVIDGPGADKLIIQRPTAIGTPAFRMLTINPTSNTTVNGVTLANGLVSSTGADQGGGIFNGGSLTLNGVVVSGNQVSGSSNDQGGGIYNGAGDTLVMINCLVVGNSTAGNGTDQGGGIYNLGTATLINTTVTGNTIGGSVIDQGAGIFNAGGATMALTNCTVSGNSAVAGSSDQGGGIYDAGTATLRNTIISGNTGTGISGPDVFGSFTSQGHNVIGSTSGGTITPQPGDLFDGAAAPLNLGALANNGGPTPTMALGAGSVAIDAGDDCVVSSTTCADPVLTTDQRGTGFARLRGAHVDIGAFEATPPIDLSLTKTDGGASVAPGGTVGYQLTYTNSGSITATGVVLTETVPANTTFNAGASTAGWSCTPNNNAGSTCTLAIGAVNSGASNSATFAVTVANPLAAGVTQISNTASIADDGNNGTDPTPGNNSASDTTPITGAPDFSMSKSDGGASVSPGGTVSYTLSYSNGGNRGATGVVLSETVPAHTTFNALASTAGWSCTPDNNAGSTCTLAIGGLVAGGGNQTATFAVTVATTGLSGVTQINNTATINDDAANGIDPTPGNNTGSDSTPVTCPTITVNNPANGTGQINQPFLEQFTQTGGIGTITWTETGALPSGVTLNTSTGELSGTPTQTGSFGLTVTATDGNGCTGSNNYSLNINPGPDVSVTVTPPSVAEDSGSALVYTVTRSNSVGAMTINFVATGTADPNMDYAVSGGTFTPGTGAGSVSFINGETTKLVSITPVGDTDYEANETIIVTISPSLSGDYNVGSPDAATGTITNDDKPPANSQTFVVNNTSDDDDGACLPSPGRCSLRDAINAANANSDTNRIEFAIPANDPNHVYYVDTGTGTPDNILSASNTNITTAGDDTTIADIDPDWPHSWWRIMPVTNLPAITSPVIIDGYTQTGAVMNTDPTGQNGVLRIEINGQLIDGGTGFDLQAGNSTIKGLNINQFVNINGNPDAIGTGQGIKITLIGANTITGNFIGTDISGLVACESCAETFFGNQVGILIDGVGNNAIGGPVSDSTSAPLRNLISANLEEGIEISGTGAQGNKIQGNFIGTNAHGDTILDSSGNSNFMGNFIGVSIYDGVNNVVGNSQLANPTALADAGNVISGNVLMGVEVSSGISGPSGNGIGSNMIGTDLSGTKQLPNAFSGGVGGVEICQDAHNNLVGGSTPEFGNVIAFNGGSGVDVLATAQNGNIIRLNSIHDNALLGIDLNDDGVTSNDAGDADTGPNELQNFPVIDGAIMNSGQLSIAGHLNSTAGQGATFTIDLYANVSCNDDQPSNAGHGEGQTYLGSVSADGDGNQFTFGPVAVPATGTIITATATNAAGSTSEFSQCFAAVPVATVQFAQSNTNDTETNSGSHAVNVAVTRTDTTVGAVDVIYAVSDGTATIADNDYSVSPASGTLHWNDGDGADKTITITVNGDTRNEPDETVLLSLSSPSGAVLGAQKSATLTIINDDWAISGHIDYCITPSANVPNATINITGSQTTSTTSDAGGNYSITLPAGGSYTFAPSKTPVASGAPGIDTADVIAAQRQFLGMTSLNGCALTAADATKDSTIDTTDAVAIQQFFLGMNSGTAHVGEWQFNPPNRSYAGLAANQTSQDYSALVIGDVSGDLTPGPRANPDGNRLGAANGLTPSSVTTVSLPVSNVPVNVTDFTLPVTTTTISASDNLVGFQGDFSFDSSIVTFQLAPASGAGLTATNWNVSANILGAGTIKTLRISAFSTTSTPLSGSGTLFNLNFTRVSNTVGANTPLQWAQPTSNFLFIDTNLAKSAPGSTPDGSITIAGVGPTATDGTIVGQVLDTSGVPVEGAAVRMNGTQNRLTITDAAGNYHFDNVETNGFYVITPSRANFAFSPAQRAFSLLGGAQTEATFTAAPNNAGLNPLDTTEYFVRQQYLDFLGREPDEAGFNFWVNNIESCSVNAGCREAKRIDTSAAFFLSIESQQTGYLVYRTYEAAYGDLDGMPVPVRLAQFTLDMHEIGSGVIVLQNGWQQKLDANKRAFMSDFVQRSQFVTAYPTSLTPQQFVDSLFRKAQLDSSDPDYTACIAEFGAANNSSDVAARARALGRIAENSTLTRREFDQAFVLMEYFGYLRRDPNSGRDTDFSGYTFWLTKLDQFNGNFAAAEMVKAFLISSEYRHRFGP